MSNAVGFLVIPFVAAIAGSVLLWMWSRSRRPVEPDFQTRLRALAPDPESRPLAMPCDDLF